MPQKIAILGGTFDPIHIGHLSMGDWVLNALKLEQVLFMPAGVPPHKTHITSAEHRLKMVELAIESHPQFALSTYEIEKKGTSFTIETLEYFSQKTQTKPYFVMGQDAILHFSSWHRYSDFLDVAELVVIPRETPGYTVQEAKEVVQSRLPEIAPYLIWLEMPLINLSSTAIRQAFHAGQSCRYFFVPPVQEYIQQYQLYR